MILNHSQKISTNLRFFLSSRFIVFSRKIGKTRVRLDVKVKTRADKEYVELVKKELRKTGFIPYHYDFDFCCRGNIVDKKDTKVSVFGHLVSKKEIFTTIGKFYLYYFVDEDNKYNLLIKSYRELDIDDTKKAIAGRIKAKLKGRNGEVIYLLNYARIKDLDTDN